jgi:hypothetical protein
MGAAMAANHVWVYMQAGMRASCNDVVSLKLSGSYQWQR